MVKQAVRSVALGLLAAGSASGFKPFANVQELKPQRLEDFCEKETFASKDGKAQLRRCSHLVQKTLEDGGEVHLSWVMHADPHRILSLDTEAEHGVKLTHCAPGELELELPESHARHAAAGQIVVGSHFVHGCEHMKDKHMYQRVLEVKQHDWKEGAEGSARVASVRLATEKLPSLAHAVEFLDFNFSYMPIEARDIVPFPEMRTDFGLNRETLARRKRRLMGMSSIKDMLEKVKGIKIDGLDEDSGGFQADGESHTHIDTDNDIVSLLPKQISNFGWNFDFDGNTAQDPEIDMTGAETEGFVKLKNTYMKMHSGLYVNFTSKFLDSPDGLLPHTTWTTGLKGHGRGQGKVISALNTTGNADVDPTRTIKILEIPALQRLRKPVWFHKMEFAAGDLPVSVEPGYQVKADLYHNGRFNGAAMFGGKTHGTMNPSLTFDSTKGFQADLQGRLEDFDAYPPMWLIFTRAFEMGVNMRPSVLLRGDMFGLEEATMAFDLAPYTNFTVMRDGAQSKLIKDTMKKLTVYPTRVVGLDQVSFQKRYRVKISINGLSLQTSAASNWGEVGFHDHVSNFDCGNIPQEVLREQGVTVCLVQVEDNKDVTQPPVEEELGCGTLHCDTIVNGRCQPSPTLVDILTPSGKVIAAVGLEVMYTDEPELALEANVRGVSLAFTEIMLRQDALRDRFPAMQVLPEVKLHLIQGGRTYITSIKRIGDGLMERMPMTGDSVLEFPPAVVTRWLPCTHMAKKCQTPRLELYAGEVLLAEAPVPRLDLSAATSGSSAFLGHHIGSHMTVPASVALHAPGGETISTIALVKMQARIYDPVHASLFLSPRSTTEVPLDSALDLTWMIADCDKTKAYTFRLTALMVASTSQVFSQYRKVGDKALVPIEGSRQEEYLRCSLTPLPGTAASEAPCSFTMSWQFDSSIYSAGDELVILVQWTDGQSDKVHEMYTPPLIVQPPGARRRLLEEPIPKRWTQKDLNDHIKTQEVKDKCQEKDLLFDFGAGMLARARVDSFGVPKGLQLVEGLEEAPMITTPWRSFGSVDPEKPADKVFPHVACDLGLCQGALPGCREAQFKLLHIPKILLDFDRSFSYKSLGEGKFAKILQDAMAVSFSVLPEAVDITIKEYNQAKDRREQREAEELKREQEAIAAAKAAAEAAARAKLSTTPPLPSQVPAMPQQLPAGMPFPGMPVQPGKDATGANAFDQWWSGVQRRLTGEKEKEAEEPRVGSRVEVRFKNGLPYVLDNRLVDMMLQTGYFLEVEDDHSKTLGAPKIVGYTIHHDPVEQGPAQKGTLAEKVTPLMVGSVAAMLAIGMVVLGMAHSAGARRKLAFRPDERFMDTEGEELQGME